MNCPYNIPGCSRISHIRCKKNQKKVYARYAVQVGSVYHSSLTQKDTKKILTQAPDNERLYVRDRVTGAAKIKGPTSHSAQAAGDNKAFPSTPIRALTAAGILERDDDDKINLSNKDRAMYEKIAGKKYMSPLNPRKGEDRTAYIRRLQGMISRLNKSA